MGPALQLRYFTCSSLVQKEGKYGADFVDMEQCKFLALRDMGIVDDSMRLTKLIQQKTANSKRKSLAQSVFSTSNITLIRATDVFT